MESHMKKNITIILVACLISCTSFAASYDKSNWFLSVDINQLKTKVLPNLPVSSNNDSQFLLQENIPDGVQSITAYGNSEEHGETSVVIAGQLENLTLIDFIETTFNNLKESKGAKEKFPLKIESSSSYQGVSINKFAFSEGIVAENLEDKVFYNAKMDDEFMIISKDKSEVQRWIDQVYNLNDLYKNELISASFNLENALAQLGTDLKSNHNMFNSAMFQKVTQISATVHELNNVLELNSSLKATDSETVKQLQMIVNGLLAMNALSDIGQDEPLISAVMSKLLIEANGNELLLSTEIPLNLIPEIEID